MLSKISLEHFHESDLRFKYQSIEIFHKVGLPRDRQNECKYQQCIHG